MALLPPSNRPRIEKAVNWPFAFYVAIYLLCGIPPTRILGWGVDIPVMLRDDTPGIAPRRRY